MSTGADATMCGDVVISASRGDGLTIEGIATLMSFSGGMVFYGGGVAHPLPTGAVHNSATIVYSGNFYGGGPTKVLVEDDALIQIDEVDLGGVPVRLRKPIVLQPTRRPDGFLQVVEQELGIDDEAPNVAELKLLLSEHVAFLFDTYAREQDENLTRDARRLARRLRSYQ